MTYLDDEGTIAEYYAQHSLYDDSFFKSPKITRRSVWKTRDGSLVAVRDMSTAHLANWLRMYARNAFTGERETLRRWKKVMKRELERRG